MDGNEFGEFVVISKYTPQKVAEPVGEAPAEDAPINLTIPSANAPNDGEEEQKQGEDENYEIPEDEGGDEEEEDGG